MTVAARPNLVQSCSPRGLYARAGDQCVWRPLGSSSLNKSKGFERRQTKEAQQIGQVGITEDCNCGAQGRQGPVLPSLSEIRRTFCASTAPFVSSGSRRVSSAENRKQLFARQIVRAPAGCLFTLQVVHLTRVRVETHSVVITSTHCRRDFVSMESCSRRKVINVNLLD